MKNKILISAGLFIASLASYSQAMKIDGSVTASALLTNQNSTSTVGATPAVQDVYLLNVRLTPEEREKLFTNPSAKRELPKKFSTNLPEQVDAGMNDVPVLDQGKHASCVTFANTAAIDAMLGKGDQISQLCHLALGRYLENNGYYASGWNYTNSKAVLDQLMQFGYVSVDAQKSKSCGGLTEYPVSARDNIGAPMPLERFHELSENLSGKGFYWQSIVDYHQRIDNDPDHLFDGDKVINQIKEILADSIKNKTTLERVTFGVFLPISYCTSAGACGHFKVEDDSWVLTNEIAADSDPKLGGHVMVITAYDDNAIAVDHAGVQHKGLFTLRNSWGINHGDHGNYYMSYDFLKKFVYEAQVIKYETNT